MVDRQSGEGTSKSARSRRRVLDAAAAILSREGYAGTRLTDVAARANIATASLYYHFASREELVADVMLTGSRDVRNHVAAHLAQLPPDATAADRLAAAISAHFEHVLEISDYASATIRNLGQVPEKVRRQVYLEQQSYGRLWHGLVTQVSEDPISDDEARAVRLLLVGAMNSAVEWFAASGLSRDQLVATTVRLASQLLGARPTASDVA